jgi:hypothetical protein
MPFGAEPTAGQIAVHDHRSGIVRGGKRGRRTLLAVVHEVDREGGDRRGGDESSGEDSELHLVVNKRGRKSEDRAKVNEAKGSTSER